MSLAKLAVRGSVGMPAAFAGPSEVVVIADETVPVDYVAIDLVVQAEHGPDGLAWLITWSEPVLEAVTEAVARFVAESPRRGEIEATLSGGGYAVLVEGPEQAMAVANEIAPEHLELCCDNARAMIPLVRNAGAVFLGATHPPPSATTWPVRATPCPLSAPPAMRACSAWRTFYAGSTSSRPTDRPLPASAPHVAAIAKAEGLSPTPAP